MIQRSDEKMGKTCDKCGKELLESFSGNAILLYSGGVDSVVCLKILVDHGIVPKLLHFRTTKLTDEHEKMIKETSRTLSPKSVLMIVETETKDYEASWNDDWYAIKIKDDEMFYPEQFAEVIFIGYFRDSGILDTDSSVKKLGRVPYGQTSFINRALKKAQKFRFPLEYMTCKEIDALWKKLPENVRKNTLTSTRGWAKKLGCQLV